MDVQTLGSLGELFGGIAVFVSIVYLAIQIRQQARSALVASHGSTVTAIAPLWEWIVKDADFARIWREGLLDWRSLDETERTRLNAALLHMLMVFKDVQSAYEQGLIDAPTYQAWVGFVASHLCMPGGEMWWAEMQRIFIPSVVEVLATAVVESARNDEIVPGAW
jgi:hypothetical protein